MDTVRFNAFKEQALSLNLQIIYTWLEKFWQLSLYSNARFSFPVWRAAELAQWSRDKLKGYGYEEILKIFGN